MTDPAIRTLIERWREDAGGTYRAWFLWEERIKNFRSIRRGLAQVVKEIDAGSFGNVYKVRYLPYSALEQHRDAMSRFGQGMKAILAVAREVV